MCPKSALVSGFNIEYGLGSNAFLFISEYACIIFLSWTTCLLVCLYGISLAAQLLRMFSQRDNVTEQLLKEEDNCIAVFVKAHQKPKLYSKYLL